MDKIAGRPRHAFIPFSIGKRQCMAQEVTFMMLRVVLFEIYRRYRLRLAPGATVVKNAVVTTKPAAVPVIRVPREVTRPGPGAGLGRPAGRRGDQAGPFGPFGPRLGSADGDPAGQRLPARGDRVRQQLRREQGTGRTVRRAERLQRLHHRRDHPEPARGRGPAHGALAARGHDVDLHVQPAVERDRVQDLAGTDPAGHRHLAELPLPRLGAGQQPVERVPRVPPLRAAEAGRTRRHAAGRPRLRRRGLAGVGAAARGLEQPGLAGAARAVRGAPHRRRGRAGRRGSTPPPAR